MGLSLRHGLNVWQLWDPRKQEEVRSSTHHFDFISDFMWTEDKRQLVCTRSAHDVSLVIVKASAEATFLLVGMVHYQL